MMQQLYVRCILCHDALVVQFSAQVHFQPLCNFSFQFFIIACAGRRLVGYLDSAREVCNVIAKNLKTLCFDWHENCLR